VPECVWRDARATENQEPRPLVQPGFDAG
jgi:hypothetical protein